ncbi:MAG: hypothetical protein R2712_12365 [Vicinamibacterales bacterium]
MSRWTVRSGDVPAGAEALVLLTVEELAVNELRETFHDWVTDAAVPDRARHARGLLPHRAAVDLRRARPVDPKQVARKDLLDEALPDLKTLRLPPRGVAHRGSWPSNSLHGRPRARGRGKATAAVRPRCRR